MPSENERRLILEMIQQGKISADDGLRLLKALDAAKEEPEITRSEGDISGEVSGASASSQEPGIDVLQIEDLTSLAGNVDPDAEPTKQAEASVGVLPEADEPRQGLPDVQPEANDLLREMKRWQGWWTIPLWAGVALTVMAAVWMYSSLQAYGVGFFFFCASLPLLLGLLIIVLAWQSRTARWLHLRVWQKKGEWPEKISISFPLPLGLANWGLRKFKHKIPGLANTTADELIQALEQSATPNAPFFVEVEDDEEGERVQVYIG